MLVVDPDQTAPESDRSLHCLPRVHVKEFFKTFKLLDQCCKIDLKIGENWGKQDQTLLWTCVDGANIQE